MKENLHKDVETLIRLVDSLQYKRAISFLDAMRGSYAARVFNTGRVQLQQTKPNLLPIFLSTWS